MIYGIKRQYRVFGSGSTHKPHAYFIRESKLYNKDCSVNLVCAIDLQFAGYFYAKHRVLRLRAALEATVHSASWQALRNVKEIVHRAAANVNDPVFWKRNYILLCALLPLLKMLQVADSNKPGMGQIYYFLCRVCVHLKESKIDLMDGTLFPLDVELSSHNRADATYKDADPDENEVAREALDTEDEDVYEVEDEWGTLYTDESKEI